MQLRWTTPGPRAAALAVLFVTATCALPTPARAAKSFVVVDLRLRGQETATTAETADRLGNLVAPAADRQLVTTDAALTRMRRMIAVPPQHETTKRLEEIYAEIKRGDELLYTNPAAAIPVLDDAKRELEKIVERLSVDGTVQEKLFQTQMLLARSHLDNGDRETASRIITEIIREYGIRADVTEENYHPDLVALYRETAASLESARTGTLKVDTADQKGLEVLLNRRPLQTPSGEPAKTPYTIENLLPGDYHVQVRRSEGDVSKIHRVTVPQTGAAEKVIDVSFDQSLTLGDDTIALMFTDIPTLEKHLRDYAVRVGKLVETDEVLAVGIIDRSGTRNLFGVRFDTAKGKPIKSVQLPLAGRGAPDERQLFRATQILCGFEDAPPTAGPRIALGDEAEVSAQEPWYTDWIGWTLVGAGVAAVAVGGYYTGDYVDKRDCAGDMSCGTEEHRIDVANEAKTSRSVAYGLYGVGGAAIVGGILVFALRDRPVEDGRRAASGDLPLLTPVALPDGGGLVFQGRF